MSSNGENMLIGNQEQPLIYSNHIVTQNAKYILPAHLIKSNFES